MRSASIFPPWNKHQAIRPILREGRCSGALVKTKAIAGVFEVFELREFEPLPPEWSARCDGAILSKT
jgi:hypothetical protein